MRALSDRCGSVPLYPVDKQTPRSRTPRRIWPHTRRARCDVRTTYTLAFPPGLRLLSRPLAIDGAPLKPHDSVRGIGISVFGVHDDLTQPSTGRLFLAVPFRKLGGERIPKPRELLNAFLNRL